MPQRVPGAAFLGVVEGRLHLRRIERTAEVPLLHRLAVVDWNEQAARAAKSYLETQAFSRKALIEQLSSDYGDGFTHAQAVYGVNKAY